MVHAFPRLSVAAALGLVLVSTGCVRRSTFQREMASVRADMTTMQTTLRQEIQAGDSEVDRRLSSRIDAVEGRMLTLERELASLEQEFGARVERMEQAIRVHTPIQFGFDESQIAADQTPLLERLSGVLREYYPQAVLTVEGFTDPAGSAAYNLRLGQQRADEVKNYLLTQGWLNEGQIRAVSYGEDTKRLIRPGATRDEGRDNRRVVIVIDHPNAWSTATMSSTAGN
jgi:peptidoglycan-associated lipoprotein